MIIILAITCIKNILIQVISGSDGFPADGGRRKDQCELRRTWRIKLLRLATEEKQ